MGVEIDLMEKALGEVRKGEIADIAYTNAVKPFLERSRTQLLQKIINHFHETNHDAIFGCAAELAALQRIESDLKGQIKKGRITQKQIEEANAQEETGRYEEF